MSIYLLLVIGSKGGTALAQSGVTGQLIASVGAGVALSFALPFLAYWLLQEMTQLVAVNAAAVTIYCASISIVTFVTAVSLLEPCSIASEGYLVAVAAMMAAPAIMCLRLGWPPAQPARAQQHLGQTCLAQWFHRLVVWLNLDLIDQRSKRLGRKTNYRGDFYQQFIRISAEYGPTGRQKSVAKSQRHLGWGDRF